MIFHYEPSILGYGIVRQIHRDFHAFMLSWIKVVIHSDSFNFAAMNLPMTKKTTDTHAHIYIYIHTSYYIYIYIILGFMYNVIYIYMYHIIYIYVYIWDIRRNRYIQRQRSSVLWGASQLVSGDNQILPRWYEMTRGYWYEEFPPIVCAMVQSWMVHLH